MPKYQVEEMSGDTVTATHIVNATTPIRAAREATERDVTLRTDEPIWIRVTDETRRHIFEYSFSLLVAAARRRLKLSFLEVFAAFQSAFAKGRYFNNYVCNHYAFRLAQE